MVPLAANIITLAVVVSATWWSSAQRPLAGGVDLQRLTAQASASPSIVPTQPQIAIQAQSTPLQSHGVTQAVWPAPATSLQADGLKPVGFTTALR